MSACIEVWWSPFAAVTTTHEQINLARRPPVHALFGSESLVFPRPTLFNDRHIMISPNACILSRYGQKPNLIHNIIGNNTSNTMHLDVITLQNINLGHDECTHSSLVSAIFYGAHNPRTGYCHQNTSYICPKWICKSNLLKIVPLK